MPARAAQEARLPPRQDLPPGLQPRLLPSHGLSSGEALFSPCGARVLPAAPCWVMSPLPWDALGSATGLARSCRCRAALCKVQGSLAARVRVPCLAPAGSPGAAEGLGEVGQTPPLGSAPGPPAPRCVPVGGLHPARTPPQLSRVLLTLCLPQHQPLAWVLIAGAGKALIRG